MKQGRKHWGGILLPIRKALLHQRRPALSLQQASPHRQVLPGQLQALQAGCHLGRAEADALLHRVDL